MGAVTVMPFRHRCCDECHTRSCRTVEGIAVGWRSRPTCRLNSDVCISFPGRQELLPGIGEEHGGCLKTLLPFPSQGLSWVVSG